MKASELKKLIKPMVEECVKESVQQLMLESGLLSSIIAEVIKGVGTQHLFETKSKQTQTLNIEEEDEDDEIKQLGRHTHALKPKEKNKLTETKRLLDGIGKNAYNGVNIFENIDDVIPDETQVSPNNSLASFDPTNPGVNIENLFDSERMKKVMEGINSSESRYTKKVIKG